MDKVVKNPPNSSLGALGAGSVSFELFGDVVNLFTSTHISLNIRVVTKTRFHSDAMCTPGRNRVLWAGSRTEGR